ncbi:MAG: YIP1 family protein [Candidatus Zixiibacteriota bacterium]|nr:MAG: YIP1 family protein [candidate division Zixibacteria bacterium]
MEEPQNQQTQTGETAMGFWAKLGNIFASPSKAFEALNNKPTWIIPILILVLITAVLNQLSFPIIVDAQLERFRSNPDIPAAQLEAIEQQITGNLNQQRIFMLVGQVVVTPIIFLLLSGIFYLIGNILLGGDATYKKLLSVFCWSSLVLALSAVVKTPLIIIKESLNVSLSPAMLLSGDALGTKLYTLLSKFDFFTIWFLIIFAIGFGMIYKFSKARAFATIGITWGIWVALSVIFSDFLRRFGF